MILEPKPLLDCLDPVRLALIELGDLSAGVLDRDKVVRRQSALRLQQARANCVDVAQRTRSRIARGDCRG